jgi:hypothetical protein
MSYMPTMKDDNKNIGAKNGRRLLRLSEHTCRTSCALGQPRIKKQIMKSFNIRYRCIKELKSGRETNGGRIRASKD